MELREVCRELGIDFDETLERFAGVEELMRRYLARFPEEESFQQLKQAVAKKDYPKIETSAHLLKGVSGNLGMTDLFDFAERMVKAVRRNAYHEIPVLFLILERKFQHTAGIIHELSE